MILALFQGVGIAVAVEAQPGLVPHPGLVFRLVTVVTLLTGTMFFSADFCWALAGDRLAKPQANSMPNQGAAVDGLGSIAE